MRYKKGMDYSQLEQLAKRSALLPDLKQPAGAEVTVNGTKMHVSNGEGLIVQLLGGIEQRITGVANEVIGLKAVLAEISERLAGPRPRTCDNCGAAIPPTLKLNARYCTDSCKQSAYLVRKAQRSGETP